MASCPFSAITKRADGVVIVDRNKCRNSRACITACPFSEPGIADDKQEPSGKDTWQVTHPMQKCNFCVNRLAEGKKPICVAACPVRAIEAGDYDELKRLHTDAVPLDDERLRYAYTGTNYATGPSLLVKMKKPLDID
jgi:anaerobic dimethyl sulfoxide reductase subunit B (iron-sulfur subunit)